MKPINYNIQVLLHNNSKNKIMPLLMERVNILSGRYPDLTVSFRYTNTVTDSYLVTINFNLTVEKCIKIMASRELKRLQINNNPFKENPIRDALNQEFKDIYNYADGLSFDVLYRNYCLMQSIECKNQKNEEDIIKLKKLMDILLEVFDFVLKNLLIEYKFTNDVLGQDIAYKFKDDEFTELKVRKYREENQVICVEHSPLY